METKVCLLCRQELPLSSFGANGKLPSGKKKYKARCHPCEAKYQLEYFYRKITEAVGGEEHMCCQICGYNKCLAALEFHHIDPSTKERQISLMQNYSLERIKAEVDKCILLCANCHREYHAGLISLPV